MKLGVQTTCSKCRGPLMKLRLRFSKNGIPRLSIEKCRARDPCAAVLYKEMLLVLYGRVLDAQRTGANTNVQVVAN